MRKLLIMIAIFASAITFASCSTQDETIGTEGQSVENGLAESQMQELEITNERIRNAGEHEFGSSTRGFWSNLWHGIVRVAKADGKGALGALNNHSQTTVTRSGIGDALITVAVGAVVDGVISSIQAIFTPQNNQNATVATLPQKIQTLKSLSDSIGVHKTEAINDSSFAMSGLILGNHANVPSVTMDSIGYYHNAVIVNMVQKNPALFDGSLSKDSLAHYVLTSTVNVMHLDKSYLEDKNLKAEISNAIELYQNINDSTLTTKIFDDNNPEIKNVESLMESYFSSFKSIDDLKKHDNYTNEVFNIVESSKLDDITKEYFKIALSVTFASTKLWNPEFIEQGE